MIQPPELRAKVLVQDGKVVAALLVIKAPARASNLVNPLRGDRSDWDDLACHTVTKDLSDEELITLRSGAK
jgi:hypothetical protein